MYSYCLLVVFLTTKLCFCSWVRIGGPDIDEFHQMLFNNEPTTSTIRLSVSEQNYNDKRSFSTTTSDAGTDSLILSCCGEELTPADDDCCGFHASEGDVEKSLTNISQEKNEGELLNQVYSLIDEVPYSMYKMVNDLTFAVYIPETIEESNNDTIWQFKEQNSTDEIDIKLHHDIVNHMEHESIYFKIALLKHYSRSSFHTISKNGQSFKHGPFIIIKTTAEEEVSIGTSALEFKIDRQQLEHPYARWNCMFWNNQTHDWVDRGIETKRAEKYITCISNHLSAFSVVMDPYSGDDDYDNDSEILKIVSTLGSAITIPCLIITIALYRHKRTRRKKISSKILINCCSSLLLLHFSFLIYTFFHQIFSCWLLNFLIHYGGSSSLLWTAADGINMWRKLFVDIFDKKKTVFYRWSKIISWGFPLITSTIGTLVTNYSEKDRCDIYFKYNIWLYMVPCILIMICNALFFGIMFVNVVCKNKIKSLSGKKRKYVMSLVQVFGLFWCIAFPLLWLRETRLLGHIIFAVFVSNQGIVIFIIRCVNEREIRSELLEYTIYRKVFHRVLTISDGKYSYKHGKTEVTGIFALSSGSGKGLTSSSELETRL